MNAEYKMNDETCEIVNKCQNPAKAGQVVAWMAGRCGDEGIALADYAWTSLVNHIAAMVNRSVTGETLDIDPELFEDVAEDSLLLSAEVVEAIGGIEEAEKYLLSIHFESAKEEV